MNTKQGIGSW